jgi:hypothetical protein
MDQICEQYTSYFFTNCGVRGPFAVRPDEISSDGGAAAVERSKEQWIERFTDVLASSRVMAGPTVSCEISPHVQTYAIAMSPLGYNFARKAWQACDYGHWNLIASGEVGLTTEVLKSGLEVASMQHKYQGVKFNGIRELYTSSNYISTTGIGRRRSELRPDEEESLVPHQLRQRIHDCLPFNPTIEDALDPFEQLFIKYGGEVYTMKLLNPLTVEWVGGNSSLMLNA